MKDISKKEIITRYKNRIANHGLTFESLGSGQKDHQGIRFNIQKNIGIKSGDKVLDVGCGLGDFYNYLKSNGINVDYHGVDIVPELVDEARKRHPLCKFNIQDIINEEFKENSFDFVVCSQVMNYKFLHEDNYEHAQKMLSLMFKFASKGVACDFITNYVDYKEDHLNYYEPSKIFSIAKSLTKRADLIHSYPLFEFTLYLFPDFKGWSED